MVWKMICAFFLILSMVIPTNAGINDGGFEVWESASNLKYWQEEDNLPYNLRQETGIVFSQQHSVALGQNDFLRQSFQVKEGSHAMTVMVYPQVHGACQVTMELYDVHGKFVTSVTAWSTGKNAWEMLSLNPAFPGGVTSVRLILTNHSKELAYFDELRLDGTMPVELSGFSARIREDAAAVELRWQTAREIQTYGFNLYRSETAQGALEQINETVIKSERQPAAGNYFYIDTSIRRGLTYFYSLADISFDGRITHHQPIQVEIPDPFDGYSLSQCYPNPFNPETRIQFTLPRMGHVKMHVFDVKGQRVRSLVNTMQEAGVHTVFWDGIDDNGRPVASGTYIYVIDVNDFTATGKMILIR